MQSRRDYLVGLGLAKPGRGKFSNDAKAALAKAESEGMKFSDTPATGAVSVRQEPSQPVVKAATETPYLMPDEYRYPEAEWTAYVVKEGKKVKVSLREACNTCRVSLVNHSCNTPSILNDMPVVIEAVA